MNTHVRTEGVAQRAPGARRYLEAISERLQQLESELPQIEQAARLCAETIASSNVVHVFGAGHSRMAAEEAYPRIGAIVGFKPLVELALTYFHEVRGANGLDQAIFLERVPGYGKVIYENIRVWPGDVLIIVSSSGLEHVILDLAEAAHDDGVKVIGVTSRDYSRAAADRRGGVSRLADTADIVIDNHVPVGDALVDVDGLAERVGASASILNVAVMDMLTASTAEQLIALGSDPYVFASPHLSGEEASERRWQECLAAYEERVERRRPRPAANGDRHGA